MRKRLTQLLPNLKRVCEAIDADNGTHHAMRLAPECVQPFEDRFAYACRTFAAEDLLMWDGWVAMLREEEIWTLAAGEDGDRTDLMRACPTRDADTPNADGKGLDEFITRFFDGPDELPAPRGRSLLARAADFFKRPRGASA